MPGTDEVFKVVCDRTREILPRLADGNVDGDRFKSAESAFQICAKMAPGPVDLSGVEAKYGPMLTTAWAKNADLQKAFVTMFPESKCLQELEHAQATQAEERRQEQAQRAQEADDQELWGEVESRGDEIATLAYKIQFGRQNFVQSRHNVRGLEQMTKYREGLIRDAFCPAKRAFVKAKGAAEYNQRAAEHCKDSAPIDAAVGGVEKTLTAECKAAFGAGC